MSSNAQVLGYKRLTPSQVRMHTRIITLMKTNTVLEQLKVHSENEYEYEALIASQQRVASEMEQLRLTLARS